MAPKPARSLRGMACRTLAFLTVLSILSVGALSAQGIAGTVSCPFAGTGTSNVFNGFYVTGYPGTNLSQVTLGYTAGYAARYAVTLTAHRNAYDGPFIGSPQTATVDMPASGEALVTFDFGGAPVSPGDTIAFTQEYTPLGPTGSLIYFDAGSGACAGVFGTVGTQPPLGNSVNGSAGVTITQVNRSAQSCIPSDTVLCLDGAPGDQRFRVTASYSTAQAGGRSGNGQAVPLAQLGVVHGGLFWFFSPDNPEVLVKILNGCALNDRYWAYVTAGTNVGFTVTVTDTALANVTRTYTNPDGQEALPVQDTSALASCHPCTGDAQCPAGLLCCVSTPGTFCLRPTPGGTCPLIP